MMFTSILTQRYYFIDMNPNFGLLTDIGVKNKPFDMDVTELVLQEEQLVERMSTHVRHWKDMREFVMRKRDEGKSDLENGKTWEEKCFTNVCDYAQNIDVHHFGGEQTSDTYYYSPLSVYCFGVVDYAHTLE